MKALVTGANGFLGSNIVKQLLEAGHSVRALAHRKTDAISGFDVELHQADVRDLESVEQACRDIDVVFHTAAIAGIWGDWKEFHGINTVGTRNVVDACESRGVGKLVYTSSPSVVFNGDHQININEDVPYPTRWLAHYPHSKALAEKHVLESNDNSKLLTCALRPHLIWGPGDRHLIPRLLTRARTKQLRKVGDGGNIVDNIYIDNAASAHLQAAEALEPGSAVCGKAYFISQDDPVNCWDWINEILSLAGISPVRRSISYYWAYRIGWMLETYHDTFNIKREPRMTRFLASQLAKSHCYDISRAKADFGYEIKVSIDEGMRRLEEEMREERGERRD